MYLKIVVFFVKKKKIQKQKVILEIIKARRRNKIGHMLRHNNNLINKMKKGNIKMERGFPRITFVEKMISDARSSIYN